jgi:hypothetical protein
LTVQLKEVVDTLLDKAMEVVPPEQIDCVEGDAVALGTGFTTMVTVIGLPTQPPALGVTVYTAVPVVLPVVVNVWEMLEPLLADAPETPDWETVQLKLVPPILLFKLTDVVPPEQIDCVEGEAVATGAAFTFTVVCAQEVVLHVPDART